MDKQKIQTFAKKTKEITKEKARSFWSVRRNRIIFWVCLPVILLILIMLFKGAQPKTLITEKVAKRDLRATVLPTGQVTSITDLSLSFRASDIVRSVRVSVGDKVKKGQILATLDNGDELGSLTQAQGSYRSAQAAYNRTLEGATNEEIALAQVNLKNAQQSLEDTKRQQATLVANAKRTLLSSGLVATSTIVTSGSSTTGQTPIISGTYRGEEDTYTISIYSAGAGLTFTATAGSDSGSGSVNTSGSVPLGTKGLYIQFPSSFTDTGTTWKVVIPNTQSPSYVSNLNAYQSALDAEKTAVQSAESVVATRQAELDLKRAAARPADLDARLADITSATGRLQSAQAAYENTILRAPADGTITKVDVKVGELGQAQKAVMVLQDVTNLYLEANINEANVADVAIGQPVSFTLDAIGPDRIFTASISQIDPAGTIISGVVNYKIKATILNAPDFIKPGMTANMTITTQEKKSVLVVPSRAIVDINGKTIVRTVTDLKKGTYKEAPVTIGIKGDDGTEITSGLNEGQEIVVLVQDKTTKK